MVCSIWVYYAASDITVEKLASDLTIDTARKANNLPMLNEMLQKMVCKAPQNALELLLELKKIKYTLPFASLRCYTTLVKTKGFKMKRIILIVALVIMSAHGANDRTVCNNGLTAAKFNGDAMKHQIKYGNMDSAGKLADRVVITYDYMKPYCKKANNKKALAEIKRNLPTFVSIATSNGFYVKYHKRNADYMRAAKK